VQRVSNLRNSDYARSPDPGKEPGTSPAANCRDRPRSPRMPDLVSVEDPAVPDAPESAGEGGQFDGGQGVDGLAVGEVVEVAGGHRDGRVAQQLGDSDHVHASAAQLIGEGVPQPVRVHPLVHPARAARRCSSSRTYWACSGWPSRVQNSGPPRWPRPRRVSSQRARASSAEGWNPRVVALSPLPCVTRIKCAARFTSDGQSASASLIRSPDRYSSISSARFRIPVRDAAEQPPMTAATSPGVSGSGGNRRPFTGEASPDEVPSLLVVLCYISTTVSRTFPPPRGPACKSTTQSPVGRPRQSPRGRAIIGPIVHAPFRLRLLPPACRPGQQQARLGGRWQPVRMPRLALKTVTILTLPLALAWAVTGLDPAAATAQPTTAAPGAAVTFTGGLEGVAASSADNAWAVGSDSSFTTQIAHWNGTAWTRVPSPSPGTGASLSGVAVVSASDAWAVGQDSAGSGETLTEQWNGTAWTQVPSPSPAGGADLVSVAAISADDAWAVGSSGFSSGSSKTLIEQWNGTTWKKVTSPTPAGGASLTGVAVASATDAWAVGSSDPSSSSPKTLIEQWNGTTWKKIPSPSPAGGAIFASVAAVSATDAWAVGTAGTKTLIEQWNGTAWKKVTSPAPAGGATLLGVTVVSATNAWAAGQAGTSTLTEQWNGTTWKTVPSPNPSGPGGHILQGVAAASASRAWAVGASGFGAGAILMQWNGTTWKLVT
jgi:hypothetical protein